LQENSVEIVANVIVTHTNIQFLKKTIRFISSLGIKQINMIRPKPSLNNNWFKRTRLTKTDLYRLQLDQIRFSNQLKVKLTTDCSLGCLCYGMPADFFEEDNLVICSAGVDYLSIDNNGDVYLCPDLRGKGLQLGNITEQNLKNIWENSSLLEKFRHLENLNGFCNVCKIKNYCKGCRAIPLYEGKGIFGEDSDCPYSGISSWKKCLMLIPFYLLLLWTYFTKVKNE